MLILSAALGAWAATCAADLAYTVRHLYLVRTHEQNPIIRALVRSPRLRLPPLTALLLIFGAECILILGVAPIGLSAAYGYILPAAGYEQMLAVCASLGAAAHISGIWRSRRFVCGRAKGADGGRGHDTPTGDE